MSYEINILAINQEKPIHLKERNGVLLHNEIDNSELGRYSEIWPFFSQTKGILYSIMTEWWEDYYSSFELCDSDFEVPNFVKTLSDLIPEEAKGNLTHFIVKEKVMEDVVYMIRRVLDSSPQRKILFQTRYEWGDTEIVFGVLKWNRFLSLLKESKLLFNVCYIVEDD